jgi:hypothetical protein
MNGAFDLVVGPCIVVAAFCTAGFAVFWHYVSISLKVKKATLAHDASDRAITEQLRNAVDSVIVELDSHPATYSTFPKDVRDALDNAHDSARQLER